MPDTDQAPRSLVHKYSPDDLERLARETALCQLCRIMFGPKEHWETEDRDLSYPSHAYDPQDRYKHHRSQHSLLRSSEEECWLCKELERRTSCCSTVCFLPYDPWNLFPFWSLEAHHLSRDQGQVASVPFLPKHIADLQGISIAAPQRSHSLCTVRRWLESCRGDDHPACHTYRDPGLSSNTKPTRLLNINTDRPDTIQLIEVKLNSSIHYSYVTLSHRWGKPAPPKLSEREGPSQNGTVSKRKLEEGMCISELPRTFRNAIEIVRACALDYIWIDSLCIIQDKDPQGSNPDWEKESTKMGDIYAGGVFNIAAIDGKDSKSGLFSQSKEPLTPVVHVRDLKSWLRPEYGYDEDTGVVDQPENATVIIQQDPYEQFEQDIIRSELLSRGWTYQEILLSPANLLCTQRMMWWSCSDATCSELFPENISCLDNDINDEPALFVDELRSRKVALKDGKNPIDIWMDVISSYSRTSVTFRDDRIVAIAGIARLFSSWFPDLLDSADFFGHFHSGIWSTKVIQQLLWRCVSIQPARGSQDYESCYIPSWSPLISLRCDPMCIDKAITLAEYVEIGSSGTTGVFGTDQFGRVQNKSEAVLHLRSVLAPIIVEVIWKYSMIRLKDCSWERFDMDWDTVEDRTRALSPSKVNEVDLRALPCEIQPWGGLPDALRIVGIVLRPDYEAFHRTVKSDEIQRNLWVRCGSFVCDVRPQTANLFDRAFALERYGWTFETSVSDNRGENNLAYVHPARTGTAPILDDVFII